ncbi:natural cytotoxicity triggering receptor 3 ligand 1-like [Lithobates pipiens]
MAERTVLGILILLSLHQTYAALDVSAPSTQRALFTRDTVLICTFSVDKQMLDLNYLIISWTFQGKVILRYDNKVFSTQDPRMSLNVESLRDGFAALHISNVTISDRGTYVCTVIYNAESKEKEISLKVFAKPLLSIQSTKVQRNTENTLTCKATGFFPPDILITWYRNGEVLRNHFMGEPQIYKDGMFYVDSTMTITPTKDDQNQTFSCRVRHDSLQEPLREDFQLIYEDIKTSSNVVLVACCVILVLTIIGVGIVIFSCRRNHRKKGNIHENSANCWASGMKCKSMYTLS